MCHLEDAAQTYRMGTSGDEAQKSRLSKLATFLPSHESYVDTQASTFRGCHMCDGTNLSVWHVRNF